MRLKYATIIVAVHDAVFAADEMAFGRSPRAMRLRNIWALQSINSDVAFSQHCPRAVADISRREPFGTKSATKARAGI